MEFSRVLPLARAYLRMLAVSRRTLVSCFLPVETFPSHVLVYVYSTVHVSSVSVDISIHTVEAEGNIPATQGTYQYYSNLSLDAVRIP